MIPSNLSLRLKRHFPDGGSKKFVTLCSCSFCSSNPKGVIEPDSAFCFMPTYCGEPLLMKIHAYCSVTHLAPPHISILPDLSVTFVEVQHACQQQDSV